MHLTLLHQRKANPHGSNESGSHQTQAMPADVSGRVRSESYATAARPASSHGSWSHHTEAMPANTHDFDGSKSHETEAMPASSQGPAGPSRFQSTEGSRAASMESADRPVSPPFLFEAAAAEDSLVDIGSGAEAVTAPAVSGLAAATSAADVDGTLAHDSNARGAETRRQLSRMQLQSMHSAASQCGDSGRMQQSARLQQEAEQAAAPRQQQHVTGQQAAAVGLLAAAPTPASRLPRLSLKAQSLPDNTQPIRAHTNADGPGALSSSLTGRNHGHEPLSMARAARASAQGGATPKPDVDDVSIGNGVRSTLIGSKENAPLGMARAVRAPLPSHAGSSAPATQAMSKPHKPVSNSKV